MLYIILFTDYQAAQVSLDTTHALLQTEVAKAEEDSEVNFMHKLTVAFKYRVCHIQIFSNIDEG